MRDSGFTELAVLYEILGEGGDAVEETANTGTSATVSISVRETSSTRTSTGAHGGTPEIAV